MANIFNEDLEKDGEYYAVDLRMDHLDPYNSCDENCDSCSEVTGPYKLEEAVALFFYEPSIHCTWNIFRYETNSDGVLYRHYYWSFTDNGVGIIGNHHYGLNDHNESSQDQGQDKDKVIIDSSDEDDIIDSSDENDYI